MFKKIANQINTSFDISSAEKETASNAVEYFESVASQLKFAEDHLDIMYHIFNKHDNIPVKSIINNRGVIDKYKEKVKENFNIVKKYGFMAIRELDSFSMDGQIAELVSSFEESIKEVEDVVNNFLKILSKYKMPNFKANSMTAIDNIKKQSRQTVNLIKDRIIEHINDNIIVDTWAANTSKDLNMAVEERVPYLTELYREREGNKIPVEPKQKQSLNPSDAQSTWYPTTTRTREIGE